MKKIILSALLVACYAIGSALTVTVHNTSPSLGVCTGCDYELNFKNLIFTKTGSLNWGYSELGYTNVAPGASKSWTLNPPAGYTPNWSTLQIRVRYCTSVVRTYGNSGTVVDEYNNCNCSNTDYVTIWDRVADGEYNVHCDIVVGRSSEKPDKVKEGTNIEKNDQTGGIETTHAAIRETSVAPNPSTGMYTLSPGTDLQDKVYGVQVIDAAGKTVFTKDGVSGNSPLIIDLTALPKGIYLLNIMCDDKRISQRLIKE